MIRMGMGQDERIEIRHRNTDSEQILAGTARGINEIAAVSSMTEKEMLVLSAV